ncbi:DUF58 domain-containing protein [Kineococcus gynurae]|uniref:DUF58 domain-containing protein n=1 Tax=Kineococcus gynurae TaxID=452979 RepID=A0ABV5LUA1_9ACTN
MPSPSPTTSTSTPPALPGSPPEGGFRPGGRRTLSAALPAALPRPTLRGWCLAAAGAAITVAAVALGQRDLLRVGVLLLLLPALALVLARRALGAVTLRPRSSRQAVEAGRTTSTRLEFVGGTVRTGGLVVHDPAPAELGGGTTFALPSLKAGQTLDLDHRLRAERRGRYRVGPAELVAADPLGLVRAHRTLGEAVEVDVLPRVHDLPVIPGGESSGSRGRPGRASTLSALDDAAVREYRDGDDVRRVHWRATARRGEVMVRADERPGRPDVVVLLDDRTNAHDRSGAARHGLRFRGGPRSPATARADVGDVEADSFEFAVSATASALTHFARRGHRVRLLRDGVLHPPGGADRAGLPDLLASLAVLRPAAPTSLARSIAQLGAGEPALLVAVLGRCGPDDVAPLARARPSGWTAVAVLATSGGPASATPGPSGTTPASGGGGSVVTPTPTPTPDPAPDPAPAPAPAPVPGPDGSGAPGREHLALRRAEIVLARAGWRTAIGTPEDGVAPVWGRLAESTVHAPPRPPVTGSSPTPSGPGWPGAQDGDRAGTDRSGRGWEGS